MIALTLVHVAAIEADEKWFYAIDRRQGNPTGKPYTSIGGPAVQPRTDVLRGVLDTGSQGGSIMLFVSKPMKTDVPAAAEEARRATTRALEKAGELAVGTGRTMRAGFEDASAAAQYQLGRYGRLSRRFVAERPYASALIAAAAGATVVAVALALLRNRRDR